MNHPRHEHPVVDMSIVFAPGDLGRMPVEVPHQEAVIPRKVADPKIEGIVAVSKRRPAKPICNSDNIPARRGTDVKSGRYLPQVTLPLDLSSRAHAVCPSELVERLCEAVSDQAWPGAVLSKPGLTDECRRAFSRRDLAARLAECGTISMAIAAGAGLLRRACHHLCPVTEIITRSVQLLIPPQELPILGVDQPVIISKTGR
ncbi:hypothetical protein AB4Z52_00100 [Rhizobium sp. 2YAF20]|uniref:hypothetical protein n=1 Tax=Rhizobium sp. 2YAF20 TaxID=3233027 RepID=UPI003F94B8F7